MDKKTKTLLVLDISLLFSLPEEFLAKSVAYSKPASTNPMTSSGVSATLDMTLSFRLVLKTTLAI